MANIKVDTTRLESSGRRIIELSKQYDTLVDDFFERINKAVKNNWAGNASDTYRGNLKFEKEFFDTFSSCIRQYGNELITHANSIERNIKKWERQ